MGKVGISTAFKMTAELPLDDVVTGELFVVPLTPVIEFSAAAAAIPKVDDKWLCESDVSSSFTIFCNVELTLLIILILVSW